MVAATSDVRVLVLGGSTEASALAAELVATDGVSVVLSLAGRTRTPQSLPGTVRVGGFGGASGLAEWLAAEHIDALVDATHPFTARMPFNAAEACGTAGVPRLRLRRPGWTPHPDDDWTVVGDMITAARTIATSPWQRIFLTIGRLQLDAFSDLTDRWFLVRSIETPDDGVLDHFESVRARGPFDEAGERLLMVSREIDVVVTKNSGGSAAHAKLAAARQLRIPVVMVARPPSPPGPCVETVGDAIRWCRSTLGLAQLGDGSGGSAG